MKMNIDDLTLGQLKEISAMFPSQSQHQAIDNGMKGKYVIVRCKDAGVHAGILESYSGREAVLLESRRLWYWKPASCQKYLSGVAVAGLDASSKVGAPIERIHLTETCEIIQISQSAVSSISEAKVDEC